MMPYSERCAMASMIIAKAKEFGADLVGFADVGSLKDGPSEQLFPKMKDHSRDHFAERITTGLPHGAVLWEDGAQTAIVYAVAHPEESPEMDWWCGGIDPPGNKKLAAVGKALQNWICETWPDVTVWPKPYHVEKGGIYLKEAAYWAGLGCIGRSNLLITPEFGPKLRLRAMLISEKLPQTGPSGFDPCAGCEEYCLKACPQGAFGDRARASARPPRRLFPQVLRVRDVEKRGRGPGPGPAGFFRRTFESDEILPQLRVCMSCRQAVKMRESRGVPSC